MEESKEDGQEVGREEIERVPKWMGMGFCGLDKDVEMRN